LGSRSLATGDSDARRVVAGCGCAIEMRRICDVCAAAGEMVLVCSLTCLDRHLTDRHGDTDVACASSEARARDYLRGINRRLAGSWQRYRGHRERVMALAAETVPAAAASSSDLAIFGAGNGSDVDLLRLAETFREVHLVDLDGEALERARQDMPAAVRERVIPHASVDLSGFMSHLDDWGESFPDDVTLGRAAFDASRATVDRLGRRFDVVLSTGVLSQLIVPFERAWVTSRLNWRRLDAAITSLHLATLVASARAGGCGVLAFDVLSSKDAPGLSALANVCAGELAAAVDAEVAAGALALQPHPTTLLEQLQFPGMASMVRAPRLTAPWLWDVGDAVQLVYGLLFRRP